MRAKRRCCAPQEGRNEANGYSRFDSAPVGVHQRFYCRAVLARLHAAGVTHGNLSRTSFFEASQTEDESAFTEEMAGLEKVLSAELEGESGEMSVDTSEELTAIHVRDGYVHPVLFWQLKHEGQISVTEEDHRAMLKELEEKDWKYTAEDVEDAVERLRANGGCWNPILSSG